MKRMLKKLLCIVLAGSVITGCFATSCPDVYRFWSCSKTVIAAQNNKASAEETVEKDFESTAFTYGNIPTAGINPVNRQSFSGNEWSGKDDSINTTQVNALADCCNPIPYDDKETAFYGAKDYNKEGSKYYQLLTGEDSEWNLTVTENPEQADALGSFFSSDYVTDTSKGWKSVKLPASWTSYGFDYSIYTNTKMPFQESVTFPEAPVNNNPVGLYRKTFKVKDSMLQDNGKVYITFGGVESAYYVYLNGKEVGYSEDSYNAHTFDITDLLNPKGEENVLAVKVYKFCDGTWLEDQDMIYDGGIFRDVYLTSTPGVHIGDYTASVNLSDDYTSAELNVDVSVKNDTVSDVSNIGMEVSLYNEDGTLYQKSDFGVPDSSSGDVTESNVSCHVQSPQLWDADHPNLYTLVLSLYDKTKGIHYESVSQNIGFREVSFTSTQVNNRETYENTTQSYENIRVNGEKLLIKGVNRHETDPETGKYVSKADAETDVKLMKQNNINAVRTSHYADNDYFYYLCDKYGLYLMCETNNESHAIQNDSDKLAVLESAAMARQITAFERLKNVTSNIMWSIGNESLSNKTDATIANGMFAKMVMYFKDRDTTRPVHFEGFCSGNNTTGGVDMISHMYASVNDVKNASELDSNMPYLLCEYDHAMGNSVGSLCDYWDAIRSTDNALGGFIWDWVDQSRKIAITDSSQWNYYGTKDAHASGLNNLDGYYLGYGGDWGDTVNDGNFCQNGLVSADRDPQPELKEVKYQYQDFWFTSDDEKLKSNVINVKNESISKNLSEYDVIWEIKEDSVVIQSGTLSESLAAGEQKEIVIPYEMPSAVKNAANYYLNISVKTKEDNIYSDAGSEIAYAQFEVAADAKTVAKDTNGKNVNITKQKSGYKVSGNNFTFVIDASSGRIENYKYKGKVVMEKGPEPNLDRAKLDNDGKLYYIDVQKSIKINGTPVIMKDKYGRNMLKINYKFIYSKPSGFDYINETGKISMIYTFNKNGAVTVKTIWDLSDIDRNAFMKEGTTLVMPSGSENIEWYGKGDSESYSDRCSWARTGLYSSTVSDMYYPFATPQDCGNISGVKWISITNPDTGYGIMLTGDKDYSASALHFTAQQLNDAKHTYELNPSDETYVTFDYKVSGTGSNSCGPATLEQYLASDKKFEYTYSIIPVESTTDKMALSKKYPCDTSSSASVVDKDSKVKKPSKVSGLKVKKANGNNVKVTWKKQDNVKYQVVYGTDNKKVASTKKKAVKGIKIYSVSKSTAIITKKANSKCYVKVRAYRIKSGKRIYGRWSSILKI